jgi:heme/copper-type cytochrome/quinol oxidase subunit 3
MGESSALKPLSFGPVTICAVLLIGGYVALLGYQAWLQGDAFRVPIRDILALVIVVAFMGVVAYMFVGKANESADILIGALIAAFSAIVAMYFKIGGGE